MNKTFNSSICNVTRYWNSQVEQCFLSNTGNLSLFFSRMDAFDQDEVDALNQAAQTARQKRAEHFRRRKVVSEVYDTVLKIDAGTQTVSYPCLH